MKKIKISFILIFILVLLALINIQFNKSDNNGLIEKKGEKNTIINNVKTSTGNNIGNIQIEIEKIKNKKILLSKDNIDEINRIESFYGNNPDPMFYILKYVETKNKYYCNKIRKKSTNTNEINFQNKNINYCNNIFKNGLLNEDFISNYVKNEDLSPDTIILYKNIIAKNNNCSKIQAGIEQYSLCKKFFDRNFNVKNTFINYEKLISGNQDLIKNNLNIFIKSLLLEDDIKLIALKVLNNKTK